MRFHHNLVDNMQDDAVDISSATPERDDSMFIHQNLIRRCVTAISTHNYDYHVPRGVTSVFRNVIDMRQGVLWNRPTPDRPTGDLAAAFAFLMHGSDKAQFVESVRFYQNTVLCPTRGPYSFGHGSLTHLKPGSSRRVFNNIFIYLSPDPRQNVPYPLPFYGAGVKEADIQADGNLHWNPDPAAKPPADYLEKLRTHPLSEQNKKQYPPGLGANCLVADPKFVRLDVNPKVEADCRLQPGSPAIDQGVALPADWEDPLRPKAGRKPDIGALPHGLPPMTVGIRSR
jgi:hypothetical protein